ncbi:hypothetical protein ONZ51_g4700 [Trametes cubensis]|uniref:Uncharacterized protein n=1 Tax=Trametes cubensis TaxID=1111947 RepID=A0AAD7TWB1_9APHY|nr:hypothetical protein ONZ51_g4700 [Trametes cubensis]
MIETLRESADDAESATLDGKLIVHALLRDFLEAHRLALRIIASASLFLNGGSAFAFGAEPQIVVLGKGAFLPLARVLAESARNRTRLVKMWDAAEGYRARLAAGEQRVNPWFTGLLPVLYRAETGATSIEYYPQCAEDAPFLAERPTADGERAKMRTQERFIELGVFLHPDPRAAKGKEHAYVPGYLRRSGSKWVWKPLFEEFDAEWNGTRLENRLALMERHVAALRRSR